MTAKGDDYMEMTKEQTEQGMRKCEEFLCSECPYEVYQDSTYTLRCQHKLLQDINKMYFGRGRVNKHDY